MNIRNKFKYKKKYKDKHENKRENMFKMNITQCDKSTVRERNSFQTLEEFRIVQLVSEEIVDNKMSNGVRMVQCDSIASKCNVIKLHQTKIWKVEQGLI